VFFAHVCANDDRLAIGAKLFKEILMNMTANLVPPIASDVLPVPAGTKPTTPHSIEPSLLTPIAQISRGSSAIKPSPHELERAARPPNLPATGVTPENVVAQTPSTGTPSTPPMGGSAAQVRNLPAFASRQIETISLFRAGLDGNHWDGVARQKLADQPSGSVFMTQQLWRIHDANFWRPGFLQYVETTPVEGGLMDVGRASDILSTPKTTPDDTWVYITTIYTKGQSPTVRPPPNTIEVPVK
jgi:hypothetical protein